MNALKNSKDATMDNQQRKLITDPRIKVGHYYIDYESRIYTIEGTEVKSRFLHKGYWSVSLIRNQEVTPSHKREISVTIHRLVAQAFIPNPQNKPCVDHINGNTSDNDIENLRWCTQQENMRFSTGCLANQKGTKNNASKYSEETIIRMMCLLKLGWPVVLISKSLGIPQPTIHNIKGRRQWQYLDTFND